MRGLSFLSNRQSQTVTRCLLFSTRIAKIDREKYGWTKFFVFSVFCLLDEKPRTLFTKMRVAMLPFVWTFMSRAPIKCQRDAKPRYHMI